MGTIVVNNLGKAYKSYPSRLARMREWLIPFSKPKHQLKWVMQGVSFAVNPGEAVGIIGINGAGKSTLLKMITGTTQPTTGSVNITGRVAALLELGMGFHPDFTGRQNAYMAGQLLGLTVEEITQLMPEIESFAEIGDYIDQPVRVYSSGMQVRLAFSVATATRPDVLIVDEALSVGDILFQQKCISKIASYRNMGTTLLFVTHDTAALHAICDNAIVLGQGQLVYYGDTKSAVEIYLELIGAVNDTPGQCGSSEVIDSNMIQSIKTTKMTGMFSGVDEYIKSVDFLDDSGHVIKALTEGRDFIIRFHLIGLEKFKDPHVGFRVQDRLGLVIFETNTYCQGYPLELELLRGGGEVVLLAKCCNNMMSGEYSLSVGIEQEGYSQGLFKRVICPTKVYATFSVVRDLEDALWGGSTNLYPEFSSELLLK